MLLRIRIFKQLIETTLEPPLKLHVQLPYSA